jgi:hypothetical protein
MSHLNNDFSHSSELERNLYQKPVVLYFGLPFTDRQQELIEKRAIEWNCSVECELNEYFRFTVKRFSEISDDDGRNYFDLSFYICSGISEVYAPKLWTDSYLHNGFKYPRLIFEDGFILDREKVKRFFLRDEAIDSLGLSFEEHLEYEYIEFKRGLK